MSVDDLARFTVDYREADPLALLGEPGTLALIDFGADAAPGKPDPRCLRVPLNAVTRAPHEHWRVDAPIDSGLNGALRWTAGGGWMFVALDVDEAIHGGIEAAAEHAYRTLCGFVGTRAERHFLRLWNYLHAINEGDGDAERYRRFCIGRAHVLTEHCIDRYPAASAIGHRGPPGLLQVFALCAATPGAALENPRQVSAWRYPRDYGPTPPSFARAMRLPNDSLAISGTAAIVGHASRHERDLAAQIDETFANLDALLDAAMLPAFDVHSPLKVYLRRAEDAPVVEAALARYLDPAVPRLLLAGDICRRELLVEIDGWSQTSR
ncbi:MAG: pteridine-dependent deoxygenase [Rhodanobacteraceae bacterium]